MQVTLYPTLDEALAMHEVVIERFGGTTGIRDMGALESALHRPQSGYYDSLSLQAAALLLSLAMNHAFVDGNKRMAFALTAAFLRLNGFWLVVAPDEGERFLIDQIIVAHSDAATVATWIEQHMQPA